MAPHLAWIYRSGFDFNILEINSNLFELVNMTFELPHDKANKMACAPSKDSDQPGRPV